MSDTETHDQRLTLFKNAWLEKLTVISAFWFIVTWSVLLPLIAVLGWGLVSPLEGLGLVLAGLVIWSLFEYVAHRYVFHLKAKWAPIKSLIFVIHGNHHEQPDDRLRNLMPPILSVPVSLCVWAVLFALTGAASIWIYLGFMLGYVTYDLTHYACHQWPMRGPLAALKRHHMRHHHIDSEANYAITAIFWDRVFGSAIRSLKR